jgi:hypothetical protein
MNKKDKRGGNRPFGDVCLGDVDMMVSFDQVYFGRNSAASHAQAATEFGIP